MEANVVDQLNGISLSLQYLLPELVLTGGIIVFILMGLMNVQRVHIFKIIGSMVLTACIWLVLDGWTQMPVSLFSGMIRLDDFSSVFRLFALAGGLMTIAMSPSFKKNNSEYYVFLFGVVLGACLLPMSMNFIIVLVSLEIISLCSYALAGFQHSQKSAEGSMKYFLFGAVSTAVMVYGISLIYGQAGTLYFASPAFLTALTSHSSPLVLVGGLMLIAGLLYKLAAAPFHIWAPDVYEASPVSVVAFLSVVPKLAALALLVKIMLALNLFGQSNIDWQAIIAGLASLTILVGNLSALMQKNIKRMMAYSSVAQSGFFLIGIASGSQQGASFMIFYAVPFLLANFVVFIAIQKFEKNGCITFASLAGKGKMFTISGFFALVALVSLTGLPPTAGFTGKLFLFSSLWSSYELSDKGILLTLFIVGLLNTVVSLFFYLKIPYYLYLKPTADHVEREKLEWILMLGLTLMIVLIGLFLFPSALLEWVNSIRSIL